MTTRRRKSKHKLLVIVPWLEDGGAEHLLADIVTGLADCYGITIVTTVKSRHPLRYRFLSVAEEILHFEKYALKTFGKRIEQLISTRRPVCILSSASQKFYKAIAAVRQKHPQMPIVDILHNAARPGHFDSAVEHSPHISKHIGISKHINSSLLLNGVDKAKIVLVPNGVPQAPLKHSRGKNISAESLGEDPFGFYSVATLKLLFVGRASPEKRPLLFVDVCHYLLKDFSISAVCVSSGPLQHQLRAAIRRRRLADRVLLVPSVERSELARYYRSADILINTSAVEGMPLTTLEAMACGCPTACFAVGGLPELIKKNLNGVVLRGSSAKKMAQAISSLARNQKQLKQLRSQTRREFQRRDYTVKKMQQLYKQVIRAEVSQYRRIREA